MNDLVWEMNINNWIWIIRLLNEWMNINDWIWIMNEWIWIIEYDLKERIDNKNNKM